MPTPTRKKQVINRAQIVEAAAHVFMEHGYASTSIDMIAKSMGCTKGYVYNYFESKIEIYFSIHRQAMMNVLAAVEPIFLQDLSFFQKLEMMCEAHLMLIVEETHFSRVSVLGLEMHVIDRSSPKEEADLKQINSLRHRYEEMFVEVLAGGANAGEFRSFDEKVVAKVLLGSLNWTVVWFDAKERMSRERIRKMVSDVTGYVLHGVTAEGR